jgi:hypothetical protein
VSRYMVEFRALIEIDMLQLQLAVHMPVDNLTCT